ncbi:MAG: hypothetical protein PVG74_21390, partial [Desulfobacterales bacterium]
AQPDRSKTRLRAFGRITFRYRQCCIATLNSHSTPAGLFQTEFIYDNRYNHLIVAFGLLV